MSRRAGLCLGGLVLAFAVAGWIPADAPASAAPPAAAAVPSAPPPPPAVEVEPDTLGVGRLEAYAASAAPPRAASRSPFAFGPVTIEPAPRRQIAPVPRMVPPPSAGAIATVPQASPVLIGIAEQDAAGVPARTAVFMTLGGAVEWAQAGQSIGDGLFQVTRISADVVEIVSRATGATTRLVLQ